MYEEIIQIAKEYAIVCHNATNHKYDGKPYQLHLQMVYEFGLKYGYVLPDDESRVIALASCWVHDTVEDCRVTFNDIKNLLGETIAEITYALTNEKGRTRKDRANDSYYNGIKQTPLAAFVKVCDRLANAKYSKENKSGMLDKYRQENREFKNHLMNFHNRKMFEELDEILSDK